MNSKLLSFNENKKPKIIKLHQYNFSSYKFTVSSVVIDNKSKSNHNNTVERKICIIEVKHKYSNIVYIHPFTSFIMKWRSKKYNTMLNKANTVVRFLNFILDNNKKYNIASFCELDIRHGEDYLTSLYLKGNNYNYVICERDTLDKFYLFLVEKKLLNNFTMEHFKELNSNNMFRYRTIKDQYSSLFKNALYPSKSTKSQPLHHIREDLIVAFLETSIEVEPRISLAIYFQIRGGLRAGEVVNTRVSDISFGDWGINGLKVNLHKEIISKRYKHTFQGSIKKLGIQEVLTFGEYLPRLLKAHLEEKKYYANDGTNALFSNKKGEMLTSQMYNYYFTKVKRAFINKLINSSNIEIRHYGLFLSMEKWSTHIGRGIASNFIADSTNSEIQVARFRRDENINSALVYIEDSSKYKDMINESGNKMYSEGVKALQESVGLNFEGGENDD